MSLLRILHGESLLRKSLFLCFVRFFLFSSSSISRRASSCEMCLLLLLLLHGESLPRKRLLLCFSMASLFLGNVSYASSSRRVSLRPLHGETLARKSLVFVFFTASLFLGNFSSSDSSHSSPRRVSSVQQSCRLRLHGESLLRTRLCCFAFRLSVCIRKVFQYVSYSSRRVHSLEQTRLRLIHSEFLHRSSLVFVVCFMASFLGTVASFLHSKSLPTNRLFCFFLYYCIFLFYIVVFFFLFVCVFFLCFVFFLFFCFFFFFTASLLLGTDSVSSERRVYS